MKTDHTKSYTEVTASALPLFCPTPNQELWNLHPRVAIPVEKLGTASCPYCGATFRLKGEVPKGHH
ncbi:MAG: zinc-finger domain-containing protein [Gallionellaceae bacterium]|jgi:uncharacterized Zn-finger protein